MRTEPYWRCIVPHLEKPLSDFISQAKLVGSFWPLKTKTHCRENYSEGRLRRSCRDGGTLLVVHSKDTGGAPGQAPCCRMSSAPWDYKPVFLPGKAHSSSVSERTLICFPLMLINDSAFHVELKKINSESILHASLKFPLKASSALEKHSLSFPALFPASKGRWVLFCVAWKFSHAINITFPMCVLPRRDCRHSICQQGTRNFTQAGAKHFWASCIPAIDVQAWI